MRIVGLTSGSGNTLWKAYELQKEMEATAEGCPFEIVGMFSDSPESQAMSRAREFGIPCAAIDIRIFYEQHQAPMKDRTVRAMYDQEMLKALAAWEPDYIMLAGYVWAVTDVISSRYAMFGVHPGDLTVQENGVRLLAGSNGVKSAFQISRPEVRASSYLVSNELDGGPILITSPPVPVDYSLHTDEEARVRHDQKLVNEQSRLVGARTALELALGHFQRDEKGTYYYKGQPAPLGIKLENWQEYPPDYQLRREYLLHPRSIAVLGASSKPGIGQAIVNNITSYGFPGSLYAVNVRGEDVLCAKGVRTIAEIPDELDMAVVAVPSRSVLELVEECGQKGVKAVVCIAAGFREVGGAGVELERQLLDIVKRYGMCMTGPNCMGIINTAERVRLNATILSDVPRRGNVAMLTQSGALGAAMQDFCTQFGIGFSVVVSTGNQAHMNVCDFLPLLEQDENTKVVLMYLESIPEPQRFSKLVKQMTKPVIVFKAGKTSAGAQAASSHTGSLAGSGRVAQAIFRQSGAIETRSLEDAFRLAATLSKTTMLKGKRVGIVSNTGGLDSILADALTRYGFELAELPPSSVERLRPLLMAEASVRNPIDLVAPARPEQYAVTAEEMLACGQYDALLIAVVPAATVKSEDIGRALAQVVSGADIPVLSCFFGPYVASPGAEAMKSSGIPTFEYPEKMVDILSYMHQPLHSGTEASLLQPLTDQQRSAAAAVAAAAPGQYLPVSMCEQLLDAYGIRAARSGYLTAADGAEDLKLRYPVVAKIDHPDIIHKSDVGGVRLNIPDAKSLADVFRTWAEKFPGLRGVYVQEQVSGGPEIILGASYDEALGYSVLTGMGGTLVELLQDVALGYVPLTRQDVKDMIDQLKCRPLLTGYRGSAGVDLAELEQLILQLNQMLLDIPEIQELDINPLVYTATGFVAVDFRIKTKK